MRGSVLWMILRPRRATVSETLLPVVAYATITVAILTTVVIAGMFWQAAETHTAGEFSPYRILAAGLVILLTVPLSTLAASAARLSARRRDDRLATLRLLGASSRGVRLAAVTESVQAAVLGILAGTLLYLASAPLLRLFPVQGTTPAPDSVWLPAWTIAAMIALILAIVVFSAITGLRQVTISPLGVRTRTSAPTLSWMRLVVAALVLAGAVGVLQMLSGSWGVVGITATVGLAVTATMGVLGVAGPFIIARLAARRAQRADTAAELIAARGILEAPKTAWRQVSGVALVSFLVVPAGSILGYLDLIQRSSAGIDAETQQIFTDVRTMIVTAVVVSFVLVACSVAVTQTAAVWERGELYVSLDRIGMPLGQINRARRLAVASPLRVATLGAAVSAALLGFWLVIGSLVMAPLFMLGVGIALTGGATLVIGAVTATTPVLKNVLASPERSL